MRVNLYRVIEECVDRGIRGALLNEDPHAQYEHLVERYTNRVMSELCDYINFGDIHD